MLGTCVLNNKGSGGLRNRAVQVYNAVNRFKLSIDQFPTVKRVYESACELEAVRKAKPDAQPDFGKR